MCIDVSQELTNDKGSSISINWMQPNKRLLPKVEIGKKIKIKPFTNIIIVEEDGEGNADAALVLIWPNISEDTAVFKWVSTNWKS